ncbi:MAG TPA: GspE/PulE family protein [Gaiellaceae bacterium]|jgi:type IV pilus assembly protein PilB|nr:GspE/PulE family protein [Gaiellaceae bacterium]
MDQERPAKLRPVAKSDAGEQQEASPLQPAFPINPLAELVADVIEATGLVAPDRLAFVRDKARTGSFAQALVDEGIAEGQTIARSLAARYDFPLVDLVETGISPDAAETIPLHVLERLVAIPYALEEGTLRVALADPGNVHAIDELRLATRFQLELGVASREDIETEVRRLARAAEAFGARAVLEDEGEFEEVEEEEEDDLEQDDGISDAPLVRLVNSLIFQAAEDGASDMHFEPTKDGIVVRFRIDGVMHEIQRIPKRMVAGVTTRLKVLAKLDIAERRKPQDGRISLNARTAGRMLDIRVATLPTVDGEKIAMRLLDKSKKAPTLEELGLPEEMRGRLSEIIRRPTGALLVTGPTGSGKSTSLYAALSEINRPEINVVTIEDPVEYRLPGISQMQINTKAGFTFASALRAILRSDPDVVMVGEIRDAETAKISIEAALTGHLVLSTMHTNDAPGAITRLSEMGVEPFLTGSAVSAVLAQRLARKLCAHCCEMYNPSVDELLRNRVSPDVAAASDGMAFYRKRGCPRCGQTGYKGRIGVFQLFVMSEELESLAVKRASREEIEQVAIEQGMRTLWDDGLSKVMSGVTSLDELGRVLV